MSVVKSLEEVCLHNLLKNCNLDDFRHENPHQSLHCFIDGFLSNVCQNTYLLCECPKWDYATELNNFCDFCRFDNDMLKYSAKFDDLSWQKKIPNIVRSLDLFFRVINYWNSVDKKVVDELFEFMNTRDHYVCRKI